MSGLQAVFIKLISQPPINGAYTELFAGLSPSVTPKQTGAWSTLRNPFGLAVLLTWCTTVIPWGRFATLRKDLEAAGKAKSAGGTGRGEEFWEWSEKQVKPYL